MGRMAALAAWAALVVSAQAIAQAPSRIWLDPKLAPEARAQAALAAMTLDEKLRLIFGYSDQAMTDARQGPGRDRLARAQDLCRRPRQSRARPGSSRRSAARNSRPDPDRRVDRRAQQLHPEHRSALVARDRGELRSGSRPRGRRDDRRGSARDRPQHHAVGRRQPGARAAQRPQLRICRRGPAARGHHGRRADRRHPVQPHHLDHQALCGERPGDAAHHARRDHLGRGDAPVRPARVRARDREGHAGLGDVLLQPHQRALGVRERLSAQHGPEGRLGLSRAS